MKESSGQSSVLNKLNPVFASTKYVVEHADHVMIDREAVEKYAKGLELHAPTNWMKDSFDLSGLSEEELAMLVTVFNSISFSYWGDPYWSVEYKGVSYDRASWSLAAAILRSKEEGRSLLDPRVLASVNKTGLGYALRGTTEIPMLEERVRILELVGMSIREKYSGSVLNLIQAAEKDALRLVDDVLREFAPAFDDTYDYKGESACFNKRAQALVEGLSSIFGGAGHGEFANSDQLSGLADYILPNLLRGAGVLVYSKELAAVIDSKQEIAKGSAYEIEIRAAVVWAIEWLRQDMSARLGREVETLHINDSLWVRGGAVSTPFHRTRTTAY